jgi:hypothetical protein
MDIRRILFCFLLIVISAGCAKNTAADAGTQTIPVETKQQREPESQKAGASPTQTESISTEVSPTLRPIRRVTPTHSSSGAEAETGSSPSATPSKSLEDLRADFTELIAEYIEYGGGSNEVFEVRSVHFSEGGFFDIELETLWKSRELQPSVAFEVIYWLGKAWADSPDDLFYRLSGQERFLVRLTTYAKDGNDPHTSETNLETVRKVGRMEISYEEWKVTANAGFRP